MGKFMRSIAITSCVVTGVWGLLTLTVGESLDNDPHDSLSLSTTNTLPPGMQAVTLTWAGKYERKTCSYDLHATIRYFA